MKHYTIYLLSLSVAIWLNSSCSKNESGPEISFERSLHVLTAMGTLDVKLTLSEPTEKELTVPFALSGSAVLDQDFTLSTTEFVFNPGQKTARIQVLPKDNIAEGLSLRLDVTPPPGYNGGDKLFTLIVVEAKEHIIYSFKESSGRLLGELRIMVTIVGELSGNNLTASEDLEIPFVIGEESTAEEGVHFSIVDQNKRHVLIKKGAKQGYITLKFEDLLDEADETLFIELGQPATNSGYYFPGAFKRFKCTISKLQFKDLFGKWKPNRIMSKDVYILLDLDESEYANLPENNAPDDYLEFANIDGVDVILPHLNGDLKNFFSGTSHAVTFLEIRHFTDFSTWAEYDLPYFTVKNVNRAFSKTVGTVGDAEIALATDENGILIYFHDYIPTDFFVETYDMWGGFDPELFGITYSFTKIEDE